MHLDTKAVLLLLLSAPAYAQSAAGLAAISGVVRDPSGAPIPGANVAISSDSQGAVRTVTTNISGMFTAPALLPGYGYRVRVQAT